MQIVEQYYNSTQNEDNKDKTLGLGSTNVSESLSGHSLDSSNEKLKPVQPEQVISVIDASILMHVLDFVCVLLKHTDSQSEEFKSVIF